MTNRRGKGFSIIRVQDKVPGRKTLDGTEAESWKAHPDEPPPLNIHAPNTQDRKEGRGQKETQARKQF